MKHEKLNQILEIIGLILLLLMLILLLSSWNSVDSQVVWLYHLNDKAWLTGGRWILLLLLLIACFYYGMSISSNKQDELKKIERIEVLTLFVLWEYSIITSTNLLPALFFMLIMLSATMFYQRHQIK